MLCFRPSLLKNSGTARFAEYFDLFASYLEPESTPGGLLSLSSVLRYQPCRQIHGGRSARTGNPWPVYDEQSVRNRRNVRICIFQVLIVVPRHTALSSRHQAQDGSW